MAEGDGEGGGEGGEGGGEGGEEGGGEGGGWIVNDILASLFHSCCICESIESFP